MKLWPSSADGKFLPRLALGAVVVAATVAGALFTFLHSEPYEFGMHFASTDPRVIAVTGTPTETGLRFTRPSRFTFGDRTGSASMTLRSRTATGAFDVELHLLKQAGRWSVERAYVYPSRGEPVTIVDAGCTEPCK